MNFLNHNKYLEWFDRNLSIFLLLLFWLIIVTASCYYLIINKNKYLENIWINLLIQTIFSIYGFFCYILYLKTNKDLHIISSKEITYYFECLNVFFCVSLLCYNIVSLIMNNDLYTYEIQIMTSLNMIGLIIFLIGSLFIIINKRRIIKTLKMKFVQINENTNFFKESFTYSSINSNDSIN